MIIEKMIFNILAFSFFVYILLTMIRKNDTSYLSILLIQTIGIALNFLEIIFNIFTGLASKIIMYFLAVMLPLVIILIEKRNIHFLEFRNLIFAKICILFRNRKQAKILLNHVIEKYEDSYSCHKLLAEIYEKEGGMRKAIDEYVAAIDIRKNDYDSYYKIGDLLHQLGKKDEATTMLNNLLKNKPEYYRASLLLGEILCEQEKFKEATNVYMEALKYRPNDYELYYSLGIAYTRLNDFQSAKSCYEKAAEINHLLYNAYYSLGQISLLYHDIEKAEDYFTKSLYGQGIDAKSYFQLAKICLLKNDKDKAVIFINKALELEPNLIEEVEKESIFIPIRRLIILPNREEEREQEKEIYKTEIEKQAIEHLENTFEIVEGMGMVDIEMQKKKEERLKEIEKDIEKEIIDTNLE